MTAGAVPDLSAELRKATGVAPLRKYPIGANMRAETEGIGRTVAQFLRKGR